VTLSHDSHRSSWLPGGGSTPMSRWGCSELRPADRPRSHQAGHPAGHTHAAGGGLNAVMTVTTPPCSPVGLDHLVELLLHGVLPFAAALRSSPPRRTSSSRACNSPPRHRRVHELDERPDAVRGGMVSFWAPQRGWWAPPGHPSGHSGHELVIHARPRSDPAPVPDLGLRHDQRVQELTSDHRACHGLAESRQTGSGGHLRAAG